VKPEEVINIGIDKICEQDLAYARDKGYTIKLITRAFRQGNQIFGFVIPQFIESTNPFATIRNEYNAVMVQGAFAEQQLFVGKGAGSYPTGSAVLSDVSALTYDYAYEYKRHHHTGSIVFSNDLSVNAFVSFEAGSPITPGDFEEAASQFTIGKRSYIAGKVSLDKLKSWYAADGVSIILAPGLVGGQKKAELEAAGYATLS
jgi:homoserine dehydrogenase